MQEKRTMDLRKFKSTDDLEKELSACAELHSFLETNQESMSNTSVSELLLGYLKQSGLSRTEVITISGLNDIYAHQIFSGKRRPSRDKLLCLCFGLQLTAEQVQSMLRDCGYVPLYVKKRRDSIILYALLNGMTLLELNALLYEEKEALMS